MAAMKAPLTPPPIAPEPVLLPVEAHPDVRAAWERVLAARAAAQEARVAHARALEIAQPSQRVQSTTERVRQWSTAEFWRARHALASLETAMHLAQAELEDSEAAHRAALNAARAVLAPKVRAWLTPRFRAAEAALAAACETLKALTVVVTRAAELGVMARHRA